MIKGLLETVFEILKWLFVAWLLWPIVGLGKSTMSVGRVVFGICMFVVFAGKLFYDTLITEFVRQRRTTVKQDLLMLLGMIMAVLLLVGFVVFTLGLLIIQWHNETMDGLRQ